MLWELIYVQYSVVCGVLAGTACFWFYITPINSSVKEYWKWNIPTLLLVWLAFNVRSEMLLLTMPFIAAAGVWHWLEAAKEEILQGKEVFSGVIYDNLGNRKCEEDEIIRDEILLEQFDWFVEGVNFYEE